MSTLQRSRLIKVTRYNSSINVIVVTACFELYVITMDSNNLEYKCVTNTNKRKLSDSFDTGGSKPV